MNKNELLPLAAASAAAGPADRLEKPITTITLDSTEKESPRVNTGPAHWEDHYTLRAEVYPHVSIRHSIETYPDKVAIVWQSAQGVQETITYREYGNLANHLAFSLINEYRLQKGDRIACRFRHGPEYLITYLACCLTGIVFMPLSEEFDAAMVHSRIERSGAKAFITHYMERAISLPSIADIIVIDISNLFEFKNHVSEFECVAHEPRDICFSYASSGTTSEPKIINLPFESELERIGGINRVMNISHRNVVGNLMQDGFDAGLCLGLMSLYAGATLRILDVNILRNAATHLNEIWALDPNVPESQQYIPDVLILLPQVLKAIDLVRLSGRCVKIIVTGSELTPSIADYLLSSPRFNGELYNAYGPTEGRWGMSICRVIPGRLPYIETNRFSMGLKSFLVQRMENGEIQILDGNTRGEIAFTGRGIGWYHLESEDSKNFMSAEEATAKGMSSERVYFTGDLGERTDEGLLYRGRLNHMLKLNGQKILFPDIENEIRRVLPNTVVDVVVTASNNRAIAFIKCTEINDPEEFRNRTLRALSEIELKHRPSYVFLIDKIPYTDGPKGRVVNRNLDVILRNEITYLNALGLESLQSPIERELKALWQENLVQDIDPRLSPYIDFPVSSTLADLGIDSISRAYLYKSMFDRFFPDEFSHDSKKWQEFYQFIKTEPRFKEIAYYIEAERSLILYSMNNPEVETYYLYFHLGELNESEQLNLVKNFECWQIKLPTIADDEVVDVLAKKIIKLIGEKQIRPAYVVGASSEAGLKCMIRVRSIYLENSQRCFCVFRKVDFGKMPEIWKANMPPSGKRQSCLFKNALEELEPYIVKESMMDKINRVYMKEVVDKRFIKTPPLVGEIHQNNLGVITSICNPDLFNRIERSISQKRFTLFYGDIRGIDDPFLYYAIWKWGFSSDAVKKQSAEALSSVLLPIYIKLSNISSRTAISDWLERYYHLNLLESSLIWSLPALYIISNHDTCFPEVSLEWLGNDAIKKVIVSVGNENDFDVNYYGLSEPEYSVADLSLLEAELQIHFPEKVFEIARKLGLTSSLYNLSYITYIELYCAMNEKYKSLNLYYITMIKTEYRRWHLIEPNFKIYKKVEAGILFLYENYVKKDKAIHDEVLKKIEHGYLIRHILNFNKITHQYCMSSSLQYLAEKNQFLLRFDNEIRTDKYESRWISQLLEPSRNEFKRYQLSDNTSTVAMNQLRSSAFGYQIVILYPVTGLIPKPFCEYFKEFSNIDMMMIEMSVNDKQTSISMYKKACEVLSYLDLNRDTLIIGYSFGGYLGFEITRILESRNFKTHINLVLIDTPPPNFLSHMDKEFAIYHLLVSLCKILDINMDTVTLIAALGDTAINAAMEFEDFVNSTFDRFIEMANEQVILTPNHKFVLFNVRRNIISAHQYNAKLYDKNAYMKDSPEALNKLVESKIDIFRAENSPGLWLDQNQKEIRTSEWARYGRNLTLHRVHGADHFSIIDMNGPGTLKDYLRTKLLFNQKIVPLTDIRERLMKYKKRQMAEYFRQRTVIAEADDELRIETLTVRSEQLVLTNAEIANTITEKVLSGIYNAENTLLPKKIERNQLLLSFISHTPYSWVRLDSVNKLQELLIDTERQYHLNDPTTLVLYLSFNHSLNLTIDHALYKIGLTADEFKNEQILQSIIIYFTQFEHSNESYNQLNSIHKTNARVHFIVPQPEMGYDIIPEVEWGANIYGVMDSRRYDGSIFFGLRDKLTGAVDISCRHIFTPPLKALANIAEAWSADNLQSESIRPEEQILDYLNYVSQSKKTEGSTPTGFSLRDDVAPSGELGEKDLESTSIKRPRMP